MRDLLVVYHHSGHEFPVRATIWDHIYAFRRYASYRCFYLNVGLRRPPRYLTRIPFALVVYHTTFLSARWDPSLFARLVDEVRPLKPLGAVKVALPQDEFLHTDVLCNFINEFGIDCVFSIFPESEWPKIYSQVDFRRTRFFKVLAGYLDEATVKRLNAQAREGTRPIDIGYRAWHAAPWLGRHGQSKVCIAEAIRAAAARRGLATDISTSPEDVLLGEAWYTFLLRCKYTIGTPGGSSILDRDGSLKARTEAYLRRRPTASFEEIEAACFPGMDGSLQAAVITPRHLEACATRTCQVLVEGEYNGILKAGLHYIAVKQDFGNLEDILHLIQQDTVRAVITERAYRDIVASGAHTYRRFVEFVLERSLAPIREAPGRLALVARPVLWAWGRAADDLSWARLRLHVWRERLLPQIPLPLLRLLFGIRRVIRRLLGGVCST
jgi:hypothetical protein